MDSKSKLREAVEQIHGDIQAVTQEAEDTASELRTTMREAIPRPLKRRVQKRIFGGQRHG